VPPVLYAKRIFVKPPSAAFLALYINIRQKLHLYLYDAVALTFFAATAFYIKRKSALFKPAPPRFWQFSEQLTNIREHARIGGRVGTRGAAYGRLVHYNNLVNLVHTGYGSVCAGNIFGVVQFPGQSLVKHLMHQG